MSALENAMGLEVGESITRDELGTAATEATKFTVFSCRGRRTIGCLLTKGDDTGRDGGKMVPCCNG